MNAVQGYRFRNDKIYDMKIIQLNIWLGHLLNPALAFIDREDPDILCAQEVYSSEAGLGLFDAYQTHQRLSELFPYQFFASTFSHQVLGETVEYGNAIYSKFPIHDESVDFTHGHYVENQTVKNFAHNIRSVQQCKVTLPDGKTISIANHHGYHSTNFSGTDESVASMRQAARSLQKAQAPLIFCGDLNVNQTSQTVHELDVLKLRNLAAEFELTTTLSSAHRFTHNLTCDYIFVTPSIKVDNFYASDAVVSDHKALILDFEI